MHISERIPVIKQRKAVHVTTAVMALLAFQSHDQVEGASSLLLWE
jgi:hypothetical protein